MGTVIGEISAGRTYTNTYEVDGTNAVSAQRQFKVQSDNNAEGARSILSSLGLPDPWDPHPDDPTIFATSADASQLTDDTKIWIVTVNYDDEVTRVKGDPPNPDPTLQPIQVEYGFERYQKLAMGGGSLNPTTQEYEIGFKNSAGEPFDPQPVIDASRPTFTFTGNISVASFDWAALEDYADAVNDAAIWGKAIGTLKVQALSASQIQRVKISDATDATIDYRVLTTVIQYNADTWDLAILDQGNYALTDPTGGGATPAADQPREVKENTNGTWSFYDGDGNPVVEQLDGAGNYLKPSLEPKFQILNPTFKRKDFAALGLPNPYNSPPS